ncbi:acetate kinase [Chitinophagaceae bacterium LB-8]|uniref:Acetate kinase n=1 Tax=Paraflavisolibacter caeni TaxID=2982496 RepID=A0A9X2XQ65_9BACT|nr:acetate kinase [Paraflavisolibacter caeni]MCU7552794.1 acetate kinase [Paraflavisolibacter caeni]
MNIFVVNSGSSSIKYQLFKMPNDNPICTGLVERIGLENSIITHKVYINSEEKVIKRVLDLVDHEAGLNEVAHLLMEPEIGVIQDPAEINAVGHRVVHGGESFASTTIITKEVKEEIKKLFSLAPLHNPANYLGIEVAEKIFTKAKQVAVFDTAFHQTMPEKAFRYAIPQNLYTEMGIRAYGFHGTSHKYVAQQTLQYLNNKNAKIITIHLGNGCSMAAVDSGKCIDTSMGFGPLSGLVMGTRSGDLDPSVIFHMVNQLGYSLDQVSTLLNKHSGMHGLTGFSDMRDILKSIAEGDKNAKMAYDLYAYRIKKYIGAYAAVLNGLDAIVFTAGVGENDSNIRQLICADMDFLGIKINEEKNNIRSKGIREINTDDARVKVLVVPTNEELEIAEQCFELLTEKATAAV